MWSKRKKGYFTVLPVIVLLSAGIYLASTYVHQDTSGTTGTPSDSRPTESTIQRNETGQPPEVTTNSQPSPQTNTDPGLSSKNENSTFERFRAVMDLREAKSKEAIKQLATFLDDPESVVASKAIDALGYIALNSDYGEMIFDILKNKIEEQTYPHRSQALVTAAMLGMDKQMMPLIASFIAEDSQAAMSAASRAMTFIASEECIPYLENILDNTHDADLTLNVLSTMRNIDSPEAMSILANLLNDEKASRQNPAAWALSRTDDEANTKLLVNAIQSGALTDEAMGIVASSPAGASVFQEVLENEATDTKKMLDLINIISENTKNGTLETRNNVADLLASLLDSNNDDIVAATAQAMGESYSNQDHSKDLEPVLTSDSFLVQEKALEAYAQYCTPKTYKPLLELIWDEDEKIRRTAFFLSSAFVNESDRPVLEKALDHPDEFIAKQSKIIIDNTLFQE